jgi:phage protein D
MLTVQHRITIGSAAYESSRLVSLRTSAALAVPVNTASVVLAPPDGISAAPGDEIEIELGYGDDLQTVFTGLVESVDWSIEGVAIRAASAFRGLVSERFNRFFEKPKAGDIVSDVAGLVDVRTGDVEPGLEFPTYALSDGVTAYDALRTLAERCGFDLYADTDDKLVFAPYTPSQTHPFQFGVNILSLNVKTVRAPIGGVEIYGESPASLGQGQDAASWLTKKDVKGTAGGGDGLTVRRFEPAARTQEDAAKIAQAILDAFSATRACTLTVLGAPAVHLGHAVDISDMPHDDQNGTFKVVGVSHRLDTKKGFYTIINGLEL